jgi:predicted methyltransferase
MVMSTEDLTPTSALFKLESLATNIPNQVIVEDISNLVLKLIKKLSNYHIRDISKLIYEPKLSSKVKYYTSYYVFNYHFLN